MLLAAALLFLLRVFIVDLLGRVSQCRAVLCCIVPGLTWSVGLYRVFELAASLQQSCWLVSSFSHLHN